MPTPPNSLREEVSALRDQLAESRQGGERDDLFRLLVSSIHDYAIFLLDPAGNVATWNAGAERMKGYTAGDIIGRHFSVFYLPEEVRAGKCEGELRIALEQGRYEEEGWRIRQDRTRFWASVVITAVRDAAGTLVGFGNIIRDLTDRRHADAERQSAEERFRLLVESVKDYALFILDAEGRVATWNAGAERIKGYTAAEIIGTHFSKFYPEAEVRAGKCEHELEVAARVGRFEDEGWRVRKDGTQFWANVVISAVRDATGTLIGFSKVTRDLTDRRRSEDERALRLAAEQANRTKDEFLAMLGHELRNPLAPIVTALQLLQLRGEARKEHEVIERQVNHMMHLVDDLLDVSRISRGRLELSLARVDVRGALAKAIEIAGPLIEQRRHHLDVKAPQRALMVMGDEPRLTQVFANLLTNAAKYTEPGGHITATVRHVGGELIVEVRDDGTGIDKALLPSIFELFVQGAQTAERATGGLGLGLTLVRSLVDLHGGRVEARSDGRGRGSTFTVYLPALDQSAEDEARSGLAQAFPAALGSRRILIVDDNEDARMLLVEILAALGNDVRSAGDGEAALAVLAEFVPDVAILDIGLPGMDGYALATGIQSLLGASAPALIALSGYGQQQDRERSTAVGFARHLVKPVDVRKLLATIAELRVAPAAPG